MIERNVYLNKLIAKKYYIQVFNDITNLEARTRELRPFIALNDSILKILVINKPLEETMDKNGFIIRASGKVEKCTVALDKPQNEVGYLDINGNLNVYCEKNKEWSERALHNKCYSCNKVFSCLNKMCPYKSVMNRNYVCENYRNFGNEG